MSNFIEGLGKELTKPKRTKNTSEANETTKKIVNYIDQIGWASRINNMGVIRQGKYTASNVKTGIPDIIGVVWSKFIAIEVKIGRDKISTAQIKCHENIIERGKSTVLVVKDFDDFLTQFGKWKKTI